MGGKLHLRLNIGERPIANKYREGKMKRSLKRELKVPEIAKRESNGPSHFVGVSPVRLKRGNRCRKLLEAAWNIALTTFFYKCHNQFDFREKTTRKVAFRGVIACGHTGYWIEV